MSEQTLLVYWHSSQIYRRIRFVLVTESPCGESDGLVLLLGSASNFICEYLLSPYVRIVIIHIYIYVCVYIFIYLLLLLFFGGVHGLFWSGVFCRGHAIGVKSQFTGSCDSSCVLWRIYIVE